VRSRILRDDRVRAGMIDHPITGVAAVGLGVWLLAPGREASEALRASGAWTTPETRFTIAEQHEAGLELLALARGLRARRDFPSLDPGRALDDVRARHPELDVDAALARVDALAPGERPTRLSDVVRSLRPLFV
jgi:hypothetical protein